MFKNTRVPVRALFENIEDGATVNDFLAWFPGVSREQVEAVLEARRAESGDGLSLDRATLLENHFRSRHPNALAGQSRPVCPFDDGQEALGVLRRGLLASESTEESG